MSAEFTMSRILPHEGRMLLIDELLDQHPEGIETLVIIKPDSVLCDGITGVPAWVGMEYMAQTACAYAGVDRARLNLPPGISLLLGTRSYRAEVAVFPIGARLIVNARLLLRDDDDLSVFQCSIRDADSDAVLASGDIKAIRPADIHALVDEQISGSK